MCDVIFADRIAITYLYIRVIRQAWCFCPAISAYYGSELLCDLEYPIYKDVLQFNNVVFALYITHEQPSTK